MKLTKLLIRMPMYLTLLNALLIACGTTADKDTTTRPVDNPRLETAKEVHIDTELKGAVGQWLDDCNTHSDLLCGSLLNRVDSVKVVDAYEDDSPMTVGRCVLTTNWTFHLVKREVTIRRDILSMPYTLRTVLAHEFGHCIFLLDHDESEPKRLMQPQVDFEIFLERDFHFMIRKFYTELFWANLPRIEGYEND